MRAIVLALLAATPVAAAATFFTLPAPSSEGYACGDDACFALAPEDVTVRIAAGSAYAFLDAEGTILSGAKLCAPGILDVPPGAAVLRIDPAAC